MSDFGIVLSNAISHKLVGKVPVYARNWKTYAHHITFHHNAKKKRRKQYKQTLGLPKKTAFRITHIVSDHQCVAGVVELEDPTIRSLCQNKVPHVTIKTRKNTRPVYSNKMLNGWVSGRTIACEEVNLDAEGFLCLYAPSQKLNKLNKRLHKESRKRKRQNGGTEMRKRKRVQKTECRLEDDLEQENLGLSASLGELRESNLEVVEMELGYSD